MTSYEVNITFVNSHVVYIFGIYVGLPIWDWKRKKSYCRTFIQQGGTKINQLFKVQAILVSTIISFVQSSKFLKSLYISPSHKILGEKLFFFTLASFPGHWPMWIIITPRWYWWCMVARRCWLCVGLGAGFSIQI